MELTLSLLVLYQIHDCELLYVGVLLEFINNLLFPSFSSSTVIQVDFICLPNPYLDKRNHQVREQ